MVFIGNTGYCVGFFTAFRMTSQCRCQTGRLTPRKFLKKQRRWTPAFAGVTNLGR